MGANNENVTFEYKKSTEDTYTTTAPSDAGTYTVRVRVKEDATHFEAVSEELEFTISKINPSYTAPTLTANCGDMLSSVSLEGTGFEWTEANANTVKLEAGSSKEGQTVTKKAKFVPADTTNYNVVENIDLDIKVTHTLSYTGNGDDTHSLKCTNCTFSGESESCYGGSATCIAKAVCEKCNKPYGNVDTDKHEFL